MVKGGLQEPAAPTGPIDHEHQHEHQHEHEQHAVTPTLTSHQHEHSAHHHEHGRSLPQIRSLLMGADLTARTRDLSLRAFALLAQAEGRIHGVPEEEVHFHEVGAVDAIVDIACCAAAVDALDLDAWYCSPVNVGSGFVNCAHGRFPVPAPATAELLKNVPGLFRACAGRTGHPDRRGFATSAGLPVRIRPDDANPVDRLRGRGRATRSDSPTYCG